MNERLFTFLNKDQGKEELMVNRKLSQTKSWSRSLSRSVRGERGGNAWAKRNEKPECLKQEEKKKGVRGKGKKVPRALLPCLLAHPQKRVVLKNGAQTLKASTRAERPRELRLLPVSPGIFVLPQISPIAAARVKQFLDKEVALRTKSEWPCRGDCQERL